jgi:predicted transcriptional regulator
VLALGVVDRPSVVIFRLSDRAPMRSKLEKITGRATSNLSRTLRTLEHYGLVALEPAKSAGKKGGRAPLKPVVLADAVDLEVSF